MQKFYLPVFIAVFCCSVATAQTDSLSAKDKAALDSMMANDEFLKMMKEDSKSSLDVSIGIGNGAFSTHNNAANATGIDNKIIYTPSVIYRTKSGFSFGVTGFLTTDSMSNLELYQTGLTAGYDHYGKAVKVGISYTRYLSDKNKYNSKSLYQNDIYGYIKKADGIIQPGLALGFDNGRYKEVDLTLFKRLLLGDTLVNDSTNNKASYFSATVSIEHDFSFYKLFSKGDELDLVPSLMINFGKDDLVQTHTNTVNRPIIKRLLTRRKKNEPTNKFEMQSVAASFDFTYSVGKFFLQPNFYLDYYLPSTTTNRLTAIYAVSAGFSF